MLTMAAAAAEKGPVQATASNSQVRVTATLLAPADVKKEFNSDLGGFFLVFRVQVVPVDGKPLNIVRDDFLLRSYKDGQKSGPYAPSQIAGRGALVVHENMTGGGNLASEPNGPVWGGIPGTGQAPRRLPGDQPPGIGNAPGQFEAQAEAKSGEGEKDNPLLATLKAKVLAEGEVKQTASGLLYFSLEGKHKPKDLTLSYTNQGDKLVLRFK